MNRVVMMTIMQRRKGKKKNLPHVGQEGFTLLEAMIALMVLTIGVLGMMSMQTTAIRGNARGSLMTVASNVAAKKIEAYRNSSFMSLPAADTDVTNNDPATGLSVRVQTADGPVAAESRWITVTVSFPGNPPGNVVYRYLTLRDSYLQAP